MDSSMLVEKENVIIRRTQGKKKKYIWRKILWICMEKTSENFIASDVVGFFLAFV